MSAMSKKIILIAFFSILSMGLYSQRPTLELTFTAVDNAAYLKLDSIRVMNRTQGGEIMIYWPDTTVTIDITPGDLLLYIGYSTGFPMGVQPGEQDVQKFYLSQSYPNPVFEQCHISMYIPETGNVIILAADIQGRVVSSTERFMNKGIHLFKFIPGEASVYILKARWNNLEKTIKIINANPRPGRRCQLDYSGIENGDYSLKTSLITKDLAMQESGILDSPTANETYTFQFATNIPCLGTSMVEYEGQVYNTIQIFSQCWLKENLNVGTMINGSQDQTNNSIKEKYCYDNNPDSCTKYGGLYKWDEMMQYTTQEGVQGLCPPGWHLPTDEEWKVLEGAVDSQYGIGDPIWNYYWERGYDAGMNLKTTNGWFANGNGTDMFGFSGLPGGFRITSLVRFYNVCIYSYWWTSTEFGFFDAWCRILNFAYSGVRRSYYSYFGIHKDYGFSVRCLRDY